MSPLELLCNDTEGVLGERFYLATEYAYKISGVSGFLGEVPLLMESFAMIIHEDGSQGYVRLIGIPLSIQEVKITLNPEPAGYEEETINEGR